MEKEKLGSKKIPTFEEFTKAHKVISKKALIIGSICAGLIIGGGAGTAIYFGVTRGSADNSISFTQANEFAKENYKLTVEDVEDNNKAKINKAYLSWDFSKTKDIDQTSAGKPGWIFNNVIWNLFTQLCEDTPEKPIIKGDKIEVKNNLYNYIDSPDIPEAFKFIDSYTIYGLENDGLAFYSDTHFDLKKNGDNISYSKVVRVDDTYRLDNRVDCTLNKNGTIKKAHMPIYGYIGNESAIDAAGALFDGSLTITFDY